MTNFRRFPSAARGLFFGIGVLLCASQPVRAQHAHPPATKASADACAVGIEQSPVAIRSAAAAHTPLPPLMFDYHTARVSVTHDGHAVLTTFKDSIGLAIKGVGYKLIQFHYHHPAEHSIDGRAAPIELHLVHQNAAGSLAVVGVMFEPGAPNNVLASVMNAIGVDAVIDPSLLLPDDVDYFTYNGSLTTPPCSEGVKWIVLEQPMTASAEQIAALRKLIESNARPVQKLNDRLVQRSTPK